MVYEKSTLGFDEFANNKRTLGVRERQVLLLVNGVRNIDDLNKFFKKDLLLDTIKKLETEGYIQLPYGQQRPPEFVKNFQNPDSSQDISSKTESICPTKMATVKAILIEATDDYLGIMGRGIKANIETCDNENSLRQTISSWHMAMRES